MMTGADAKVGTSNLKDILELIQADLRQVEIYMASRVTGTGSEQEPLSREIIDHVLGGGGKRLRPALILLSGRLCGGPRDDLIRLAAAIELLHTATLLHDDVVDGAELRRGRATVASKWDPGLAVLSGDLLFSVAFSILASFGQPRMLELMSGVIMDLSRGEMSQYEHREDLDVTEAYYLALIQKKTAALMAASMLLGAMAAGSGPQVEHHLHRYGLSLGMAFQISDDVLDFDGSPEALGKQVVSDLDNGVITLPLIHSLRDSRIGPRLRTLLTEGTSQGRDQVVLLIREAGGLDYARSKARSYGEEALEALSPFEDCAALSGLKWLARFAVDRKF